MAISTLAYKITADTRQFNTNMKLTRSELTLARRALAETATPAERLQGALTTLEKLYKANALTAEEYTRAQKRVREEITGSATAGSKINGFFGQFGSLLQTSVTGIAASLASFLSLRNVLSGIAEQMREIDELAKTGRALDIDPNRLAAFRAFAAERGIDEASAQRALSRVQSRIQLAAIGDTEALSAFELGGQAPLPREFQRLAKLDAVEQLIEVIDRIEALPESLQTAAVSQIFGERRILLKNLRDATIDEFRQFEQDELARVGKVRTSEVERVNDLRDRLSRQGKAVFGGAAEDAAILSRPILEFLDENARRSQGKLSGRRLGERAAGRGEFGVLVPIFRDMLRSMQSVETNTDPANQQPPVEVNEVGL